MFRSRGLGAILVVIFLLVGSQRIFADFYSIKQGEWSDPESWSNTSGGESCNCTPKAFDKIFIESDMVLNRDFIVMGNLNIREGASLISKRYSINLYNDSHLQVDGNLSVFHLYFHKDVTWNISPTGSVVVYADFSNMTEKPVFVEGKLNIAGNFNNLEGGNIYGSGYITAYSFTGTGRTFGVIHPDEIKEKKTLHSTLYTELVDFFAQRNDKGFVEIKWSTAYEFNIDSFYIQRSLDSTNFSHSVPIPASHNSFDTLHYSMIDTNAVKGKNYYRLILASADGGYKYSGVRSIDFVPLFKKDFTLPGNIYQGENPTAMITGFDTGKEAIITVKDYFGKQVAKYKFTIESNEQTDCPLNKIDKLIPGYYKVECTIDESTFNKDLIIR